MSKEKEIKCEDCLHHFACEVNSEYVPSPCRAFEDKQGYRKQSEGEWEQQPRPYEDEIMCSVCGANFNIIDNCTEKFDYCPNCGAKMKGGE